MSRLVKATVLALFALLFSTAALAQVALGETVDNNVFAVDYPSGWIVDAFLSEGENRAPRPVVFLYSSAAAQAVVTGGGDVMLPKGEAVAYVTANDDGMLTTRATLDELIAQEEAAGSEVGTVSEIATSGYDGFIVSLETSTGDGFAGVLGSRELRITFVTLAAKGNLADYEETFEAIINSIRPGSGASGSSGASGATSGLVLEYGETAAGFISDSDGDVWTFEGRAGDVISISMAAVTIDSYLEVYAPNGTLLAEDDDSGGSLNALIEGLRLPADGTYTVVARTYSGTMRGGYELELSAPGAPAASGMGPLADQTIGDVREGNLPLGETHLYTFEGRARQVVTILLQSSALTMDPFLKLYNSDGVIIAQDDDSAGNLNAIIENFVLPADDTYTIEVTTASGDGGGIYRLTLVGASLVGVPVGTFIPAAPGQLIAVGDTITGNLPLGETLDYTFEGRAGMVVTITLESDAVTMDPYLELRDPSMWLIAEDDDSAGNLNARISRVTLPVNGIYTIVVRTYANSGGGAYTLTLR